MKDILRLLQREKSAGNEIILPKNRVLLFDKDETLLNRKYQLTDTQIQDTIRGLQDQGWILGISSDAALEILQPLSQQLGLNGPLIAERGAIVQKPDGEILMNSHDIDAISSSRHAMEQHLSELGIPVILNTDPRLKNDTVDWGKPGEIIVVINALRKCSIALNIKRIQSDGNLGFDEDATNTIVDAVKPFYPIFSHLFEDVSHDYGVLIVSNGDVNKRSGTQLYLREAGLQQVGMIGNSESDYVGDDIAVHYAVGNGTNGFKKNAVYTAQASLTQGVIEILSKIQQADSQRTRRGQT